MKNKKSLIMALGALALVATIGIGSTYAYFTDDDTAENAVTMGHLEVSLVQTVDGADEDGYIHNAAPGDEVNAHPIYQVADDSLSAYARIKIAVLGSEDLESKDASELTEKEAAYLQDLDDLRILINDALMEKGWIEGEGGFLYWEEELAPGESLALYDGFTIPLSWGNEASGQEFRIKITAEGIQAANFALRSVDGVLGWYGSDDAPVSVESYVVAE